jgi:hypothetical protein
MPGLPSRPGANWRAAAVAAACATARGSAFGCAAAARLTVSAASRTNWRAPSNSISSFEVSASSPSAPPAAEARPLPIWAPRGPPKKPPRAPPASGSAFLATPLRTPPMAWPTGDLMTLPATEAAFFRKLPRNCSSSASLLTDSRSLASSISSASEKTPPSPDHSPWPNSNSPS